MHLPRRLTASAAAAASVALVLFAGVSTANASHFRASGPDLSITGDVATWVVTTAWESGGDDAFVGMGNTTEVRSIDSYSDEPGTGGSTGVELEVISEVVEDEPLYAKTVETMTGNLASLPDGLYELYVESCCRVDDIVNSAAEDFSQWVRFSKTGSTYAVAPRLTTPTIYVPLALDGTTTMVAYSAPGAASWTAVTDESGPFFGSNELPCSTFVGGALEIGAEHCTGGDVYTDIYLTGTFWAFKTIITDADGRESVAETLFRVESIPAPYLNDHTWIDGGAAGVFEAFASDAVVTSWTVTCTNVTDPTDVASGTSPTSPITVTGFTAAEEYDCVVAGTNGAGTGTSSEGDYTVVPPGIALDLQFTAGDFYAGQVALIEGSGLDSESDYTLTMFSDPILLHDDITDGDGAFSEDVIIPEEACIPGEHELRLVGEFDGNAVSASQYVEIDENCYVVRTSATPFGDAELADTGSAPTALAVGLGASTLALGALLLMGAGFVRRASRRTV